MRTILASILAVAAAAAGAQAQTDPLASWAGTWQGACELSPPYAGAASFDASLNIVPTLGGRYDWQIIYEASGSLPRSVRNYEMVPVDALIGHFVLDEKNGLLLDSFIAGRAVRTYIAIGGNRIPGLYLLLSEREMLIDLPLFAQAPIRNTCLNGNPSQCTDSYRLNRSQTCRLVRTR